MGVRKENVDGPDKPGHDGFFASAKPAIVIPAKAGIHRAFGIQWWMHVTRRPWAPAFAGVTQRFL